MEAAGAQPGRHSFECLQIGLLLPQEEGPGDPPPSWSLIASAARVAEQATERRVGQLEEALRIIVPMLRDGEVDFTGELYRAQAVLKPRLGRPTGPPIMIGALRNRPRMLGLVARYADIWNGWMLATSATGLRDTLGAVDAACVTEGRDPATLARSTVVAVALDGPMTRDRSMITGSDEQIAETLASFGDEGIDEVMVRLFPNDPATIERFGRVVAMCRAARPR